MKPSRIFALCLAAAFFFLAACNAPDASPSPGATEGPTLSPPPSPTAKEAAPAPVVSPSPTPTPGDLLSDWPGFPGDTLLLCIYLPQSGHYAAETVPMPEDGFALRELAALVGERYGLAPAVINFIYTPERKELSVNWEGLFVNSHPDELLRAFFQSFAATVCKNAAARGVEMLYDGKRNWRLSLSAHYYSDYMMQLEGYLTREDLEAIETQYPYPGLPEEESAFSYGREEFYTRLTGGLDETGRMLTARLYLAQHGNLEFSSPEEVSGYSLLLAALEQAPYYYDYEYATEGVPAAKRTGLDRIYTALGVDSVIFARDADEFIRQMWGITVEHSYSGLADRYIWFPSARIYGLAGTCGSFDWLPILDSWERDGNSYLARVRYVGVDDEDTLTFDDTQLRENGTPYTERTDEIAALLADAPLYEVAFEKQPDGRLLIRSSRLIPGPTASAE